MDQALVRHISQRLLDEVAGQPTVETICAQAVALGIGAAGIAQDDGRDVRAAIEIIDAIAADAKTTARKRFGSVEARPPH